MALGCSPVFATESNPALDAQLVSGAEIYEQSCVMCHFDGTNSSSAPELKGSAIMKEPVSKAILVILKGQSGVRVVNGKKFNGQMPPTAYLSDEEVAAVTAYILANFGGPREYVDPATVAPLRK